MRSSGIKKRRSKATRDKEGRNLAARGRKTGWENFLPSWQEERLKAERQGREVRYRVGDGARTRETGTQFHLCQVFVADNGENTMHRREFQKLRRMRDAFWLSQLYLASEFVSKKTTHTAWRRATGESGRVDRRRAKRGRETTDGEANAGKGGRNVVREERGTGNDDECQPCARWSDQVVYGARLIITFMAGHLARPRVLTRMPTCKGRIIVRYANPTPNGSIRAPFCYYGSCSTQKTIWPVSKQYCSQFCRCYRWWLCWI